jgi:hypothetical protein
MTSSTSAAGQKSGHVLGDEAHGRQGATRAHSRSYETEEQRSRPGWIGSQNMAEILNGGTRVRGASGLCFSQKDAAASMSRAACLAKRILTVGESH